jgi:YVTN family beta-propeller protein
MVKGPSGALRVLRWPAAALVLAASLGVGACPLAAARDAYVGNEDGVSVSVIDTQTNQVVGSPIGVEGEPAGIAITPDGQHAYVADFDRGSVSVIDTQTNQVVGSPIEVGELPSEIAVTPDGRYAYVTNQASESVSVIDTQTNQVVGSPIPVGGRLYGIAITPDGTRAYVTDYESDSLVVIDLQTNQVVGSPIVVGGEFPVEVAITPNGRYAYVVDNFSSSVSVVDLQTNQVVGSPITVGSEPVWVSITPDGRYAYVADYGTKDIRVIDTQTNQVVGSAIALGDKPGSIAFTPDGGHAYFANPESESVSLLDPQSNQLVGSPIQVGSEPFSIAITPDQPPLASFAATGGRARPGVPVAFSASGSSDPDGTIARFDWVFGDGQTAPGGGPTPSHTFRRPGTYRAALTLTDNEGCSTALVFTGQTAYCNGRASAAQTETIKVAYPGVRVRCSKRAKPEGCRFKLQAVTKKRRGRAESAVAKVKLKAGKSKIVSLRPKKKFGVRLARAKKILVRETMAIKGARRSVYRGLKVVR